MRKAIDYQQAIATIKPQWLSLADQPNRKMVLKCDDIHIVLADLDKLKVQADAAILSQLEQDKLTHIKNTKIRRYYLHTRVMLKHLLHRYSGIPLDQIKLSYGVHGKPSLASINTVVKLCFNYSNSGKMALYVFGLGREVGIDLELLPRKINCDRLAQHILHREEWCTYKRLAQPFCGEALLACWTRKEAFGKAIGVGIGYGLEKVPLFTNPELAHFTIEPKYVRRWAKEPIEGCLTGIQLKLPTESVATLVYQGGDVNISAFTT